MLNAKTQQSHFHIRILYIVQFALSHFRISLFFTCPSVSFVPRLCVAARDSGFPLCRSPIQMVLRVYNSIASY